MLTIQQAEEKIAFLSAKAAQMEVHCRQVEQAATKLDPLKKYIEAVSELSRETVEVSAESLMRRMVTLQSTNDELKRQLSDAVDRLEQGRLECKARQRLHQSHFAPKGYIKEDPSPISSSPKDTALSHARFLDIQQATEYLKQIGELAHKYKAIIKEAEAERDKIKRRGQRPELPFQDQYLPCGGNRGPVETSKRPTLGATSRSASAAPGGGPGCAMSKVGRLESVAADSGRSSPRAPLFVRRSVPVEVEVPLEAAEEDVVELVVIKTNGGNHRSPSQASSNSTLSAAVYHPSASGRQHNQGVQFGYSSRQQRTLHTPAGSNKTAKLFHSPVSDKTGLASEADSVSRHATVVASRKFFPASCSTKNCNIKRSTSADETSPGRSLSSRWATTRTKAALQQQKKRNSTVSLPKIVALDSSAVGRRRRQSSASEADRPSLLEPPKLGCLEVDPESPKAPNAEEGGVTLSQRVRFSCDILPRNWSFAPPSSSESSRGQPHFRAFGFSKKLAQSSCAALPPIVQRFVAHTDSISVARSCSRKTLGKSMSKSCTELRNIQGFRATEAGGLIQTAV
ncbi:hypothetical protein TGPRC2_242370 [Toxoplasma gondii TgCatPRC2]|uniref:Uncharacterized protein n=1 Tax=Toxoplasma gondii TgCatPRC2 TaxID=1130821 RepID=A0A151HSS0_TOXGO|nr:hypothetical protein TGPRC2_242370 [Toxoplasma gondii TgCatPRC2]